MPTHPAPPPPPAAQKSLETDIAILDRLHRRNKNQHRTSKWYKWLLILRRNLKKLVANDQQVEARLRFMRRVVIPSCYIAFSTVVANKRFAPLGVVLVGILASVHRFVGPEPEEIIAENKKEKEVEVVEEEEWEGEEGVGNVWALDQYALDMEDLGESISRRPGDDWSLGGARRGERLTTEEKTVCSAGNGTAVAPEEAVVIATGGVEPPSKSRNENKDASPLHAPTHSPEPSLPTVPQPQSPLRPPAPPAQSRPPPSSSRQKPKKRQKADDALREPRKKQKKQKKRDEIDELFSGIL